MEKQGKVKRSGKRFALLMACMAVLAASVVSMGSAAPASGSSLAFCVFAKVAKGAACGQGQYKKVTRVNARAINGSFCAGAFNSNGVQVGGWTCSGEVGETSNGNYDGSKNLNAAVYNNALGETYVGEGIVFYNP